MAVRVSGSPNERNWLENEKLQALLRMERAIAFEYDIDTRKQVVSPHIERYFAGNYDGRLLSDVMLEDQVIHPKDVPLSLGFREKIRKGEPGEVTLRLLTPSGEYRWFRMSIVPCDEIKRGLYIGLLEDVDSDMRLQELLRYRAEYDPVSGIYNKLSFYEATQKMLEGEKDCPLYLIRFDIDRFKIVNELYSMSEGDLLLRHVGKNLKELILPGETYARMRDDVFCACLRRPENEAVRLLEQLEIRINEYPLSFHCFLSAGIVRIDHYDGQPVNILCDRAALAQQKVKGNYLKRYAFYDPAMSEALNREHYITGCMERSLEQGQFEIYLQPKFDMRDNHVVGAEALARWNHPQDGMISPGEFIPLFERNGFIIKLDEYIWELACKTLRRWIDMGREPIPISVNVSRVHLYDADLCQKIIGLIEKYQIPPSLLELEITESAYIESPQSLYAIMERLQAQGFIFSMDDFGNGYSSLNALKDIPVNLVKIDLNFLREARRGEIASRDVLKGTIQLVRGMGLPVIVEGVETQEQTQFLLQVGCVHAQGYYFSRPMPIHDFEKRFY